MARDLSLFEKEEVFRAVALQEEEPTQILRQGGSSKQKPRHVTAAFAQTNENLTCNTNQTLSKLNAPLSDYHVRSKGPVELTWAKSLDFVHKIENCDTQRIMHESYKIQACVYRVPRFTQFRVQLFEDGDTNPEFPIVVELQRRDGDAFLTGILFKGLRDFFKDENVLVPVISGDPAEGLTEFQGLDLSRGEDDALHWANMMNTSVLETARSGANALALACQNESNISYLMECQEIIVQGIKKLLTHSKDCPTIFGCATLLTTLSTEESFCDFCAQNDMILPILNALHDWSGEGKYDVSSTTILLKLTETLERLRDFMGDDAWQSDVLLHEDFQEILNNLAVLLKDRKAGDLGERLRQVLFADDVDAEAEN